MKLRVGLVGLGDHWESRHRPSLKKLSDKFDVIAIACEVAARSKGAAEEFDAVALDGFRAMIERDDIDAILALAPDWVGPLPMIAACEAGKAVYSSAALDIAPDQATGIRQRVEDSGVAFMAEFPRRYAPATIRLKELLATRLGRPLLLFCHERAPVESQANSKRRGDHCSLVWRNLMEQVDWCRYLVGSDPNSVLSAAFHNDSPGGGMTTGTPVAGPDCRTDTFYQMISLEFPVAADPSAAIADSSTPSAQPVDATPPSQPGPIAQLSIGHYIPDRWSEALAFRRPPSIQVSCERGVAFIDLPSSLIWFDDAGQHVETLDSEQTIGERMLDHFHRAVTSFIRRTSGIEDAYKALQIVQAADESARLGRRIDLPGE